jgi:hypothetical protein
MVNCIIPIKFPLKPNVNGICFTKEALEHLERDLENMPIINKETGNAVGILSGAFEDVENEEMITVFADGKIFSECYPEIQIIEKEGNVIKDFKFNGISI